MSRGRLLAIALVAALAGTSSASAQGLKPTGPGTVQTPVWQGIIRLPDGRTFVSDGGLAIDAAIAKPAVLPSTVLPESSSRSLQGHLSRKNPKEVGFADLKASPTKNAFVTADGVGVNGNYVTFLRRVVPNARLRTAGSRDPIVVVVDGRSVAVFMPFVLPERK
jgi:hypothetical protein